VVPSISKWSFARTVSQASHFSPMKAQWDISQARTRPVRSADSQPPRRHIQHIQLQLQHIQLQRGVVACQNDGKGFSARKYGEFPSFPGITHLRTRRVMRIYPHDIHQSDMSQSTGRPRLGVSAFHLPGRGVF
jgi:hypothetical protein